MILTSGPSGTPNLSSFLTGRHSWTSRPTTAIAMATVALATVATIAVLRLRLGRNSTSNQQTGGKLSNPIKNVNLIICLVTMTYILGIQVMGWMSSHNMELPKGLIFPTLGIGIPNAVNLTLVFIFNAPALAFAKRKLALFFDLPFSTSNINHVEEIQLEQTSRTAQPSTVTPTIPATSPETILPNQIADNVQESHM